MSASLPSPVSLYQKCSCRSDFTYLEVFMSIVFLIVCTLPFISLGDALGKWQIGFQGSAKPNMQGLFFTLWAGCAGVYRKEQWQVPLAAALLELRECAQRQHKHKVLARAGAEFR